MSEESKTNPTQSSQAGQQFNILPHPAKSNNPADLAASDAAFLSNPAVAAFHARDPFIPNQEVLNKVAETATLSREELEKRSEELNK